MVIVSQQLRLTVFGAVASVAALFYWRDFTMKENTGYPSIDRIHFKGTKWSERHPWIPNIDISSAIDFINMFRPNTYAFDCLELRVTHRKFKKDAVIIAKALLRLGVSKGDIVPVNMPNFYQAVAVFKAANQIGAITTFLNPWQSDDELKQYIETYRAKVLFNYNKSNDYNQTLLNDTCLKHIVTLKKENVNSSSFNEGDVCDDTLIDYQSLKSIASSYKGTVKRFNSGNQDALILYTSGSTGEPKSLLFTNKNILSALIYLRNSTNLPRQTKGNNRWLGVVPIMYPYGFACSVLAPLMNGNEVIMAPNISSDNVAYYYDKHPSLVFGSPAFLEVTMRNLPDATDCSEIKQFVSGGDFLSESQSKCGIEFFRKHKGNTTICNGSGNGELLGCCTNAMNVKYRPDTVGQLVLGPEYVIVSEETGEEVKYGESGVLMVRGNHVFKGYYGRDDLTKEVKVIYKGKEYYKTGNIGYLDKERYFHMVGRSSRFFIIYTLNKVYCELVQSVVSKIDVVESCAVVPRPDKDMLFVSQAFVVLKPGYESSDEIKQHIINESRKTITDSNGQQVTLKEYEVPKFVVFLEALPRTHADKIDYRTLEKLAEENSFLFREK